MEDAAFIAKFQDRRVRRMARIDALSPDIRELVHEYGFNIVNGFLDHGVVKPRAIRHLVETVLDEFSPTRGSFSSQGPSAHQPTTPETGS